MSFEQEVREGPSLLEEGGLLPYHTYIPDDLVGVITSGTPIPCGKSLSPNELPGGRQALFHY
jgi:hypothetical protein